MSSEHDTAAEKHRLVRTSLRRRSIIIVGAGQAGGQTAASLRENGFDGDVLLIGDEPDLPYQRPPLSKNYLSERNDVQSLHLRPEEFYRTNDIELIAGVAVQAIDARDNRVHLTDGGRLEFDQLVLATGARNRVLALPGAALDGVLSLRTRADADVLRERLHTASDVAVIGGGFIGLELASAAAKQGKRVTVIETCERVMARAVSTPISRYFEEVISASGGKLLLNAKAARMVGSNGRVAFVEMTEGQRIPADLVIVGVGVVSNSELAAAAGLAVEDGILVDEQLASSHPYISAVGDCARYPNPFGPGRLRLESVQNAIDHAHCVANRLTGRPESYRRIPWFWSDQWGLRLQIAGLVGIPDTIVTRGDSRSGAFSTFCFRDGRLVAIESVNRSSDHMAGRRILAGTAMCLTPEQAADESFDLRSFALQATERLDGGLLRS